MRKIGGIIIGVLAVAGLAKADNSFSEIDLTSFQDIPSIIDACDAPIQNVGYSNRRNCKRFYITGLWGPSAATLNDKSEDILRNNSQTIFTAGIAGGLSLERNRGRLRVEAEWLQRDYFESQTVFGPTANVIAINNWSVLTNVWRDFMFTNRFGCYGGGGIGAGGLRLGETSTGQTVFDNASTAFAWQAGGGLIYEISDQVTFDASYRWYQLGDFPVSGGGLNTDDFNFAASQIMFSIRVFEPLRSLLR